MQEDEDEARTPTGTTNSRKILDRNLYICDELSRPQPSPANSEDMGSFSGSLSHINTEDIGIGLQDFKLDEAFLDQFDPSVQSKLKLIISAHDNAKKYLDITVKSLNNQKQYLKYMSEQNRYYNAKLDSLETELKREHSLKEKAESDTNMWKEECQKAEVTFNKVQIRKKQIQVTLAKMYDRYDALMSENRSLRRLVANLSFGMEEKPNACLPARKPKHGLAHVRLTEAKSDTIVRLPPIARSSQGRGLSKSKRNSEPFLPPIGKEKNRYEDIGQQNNSSPHDSSVRPPTPWYNSSDNNQIVSETLDILL